MIWKVKENDADGGQKRNWRVIMEQPGEVRKLYLTRGVWCPICSTGVRESTEVIVYLVAVIPEGAFGTRGD